MTKTLAHPRLNVARIGERVREGGLAGGRRSRGKGGEGGGMGEGERGRGVREEGETEMG